VLSAAQAAFFQEHTKQVLAEKLEVCEHVVNAKFNFKIEDTSKREDKKIVDKAFEILLNKEDKYALMKGIPLALTLMTDSRLVNSHFAYQELFDDACKSTALEHLDLSHLDLKCSLPPALKPLLPKLKFYKFSENTLFDGIPRDSMLGDLVYMHRNLYDEKELQWSTAKVGLAPAFLIFNC
jgi:hypothetical protein